jgi:hypothetical protein
MVLVHFLNSFHDGDQRADYRQNHGCKYLDLQLKNRAQQLGRNRIIADEVLVAVQQK